MQNKYCKIHFGNVERYFLVRNWLTSFIGLFS